MEQNTKPWFKFYAQAWLSDPIISGLPHRVKGVLVDLMCMAAADAEGAIRADLKSVAKSMGIYTNSLRTCIELLANLQLIEHELDGNISIPSIAKQHSYTSQQRAYGKMGGNQTLKAPLKVEEEKSKSKKKKKAKKEKSLSSPLQPKPRAPVSALEADFTSAWEIYPSKTGKAKAKAAYIAARRQGAEHSEVMDGIERYRLYVDRCRSNGFPDLQFRNGDTWFRNHGWLDEFEVGKRPQMTESEREDLRKAKSREEGAAALERDFKDALDDLLSLLSWRGRADSPYDIAQELPSFLRRCEKRWGAQFVERLKSTANLDS